MDSDVPYTVYFTLPNGKVVNETDEFATLSQLKHEPDNRRKSYRNLTVEHAVASRDEGDYTCTVKDFHENSNSVSATIRFIDEPIMEWKALNPNITTTKSARKRVQFLIGYMAYPFPTFEMYNNRHEMIARGNDVINREKYDITISRDEVKFVVKFPGIEDYGEYTLLAQSDSRNYTQKLYLIVSGNHKIVVEESFIYNKTYHHKSLIEKPTCTMESVYIMAGEQINMTCECLAYPSAEMSWSFQACSNMLNWPECGRQRDVSCKEYFEMHC